MTDGSVFEAIVVGPYPPERDPMVRHEVGKKTLEALRARFPEITFSGREAGFHHVLRVTCVRGAERFSIDTSGDVDYRAFPFLWWLHRFSVEITRKWP